MIIICVHVPVSGFEIIASLMKIMEVNRGVSNPAAFHVIYQARNTVFDHISNHREEIGKYDTYRSILEELQAIGTH